MHCPWTLPRPPRPPQPVVQHRHYQVVDNLHHHVHHPFMKRALPPLPHFRRIPLPLGSLIHIILLQQLPAVYRVDAPSACSMDPVSVRRLLRLLFRDFQVTLPPRGLQVPAMTRPSPLNQPPRSEKGLAAFLLQERVLPNGRCLSSIRSFPYPCGRVSSVHDIRGPLANPHLHYTCLIFFPFKKLDGYGFFFPLLTGYFSIRHTNAILKTKLISWWWCVWVDLLRWQRKIDKKFLRCNFV